MNVQAICDRICNLMEAPNWELGMMFLLVVIYFKDAILNKDLVNIDKVFFQQMAKEWTIKYAQ